MEYFPAPLEALVEQFARLPGIGGKTAQRLAFHKFIYPGLNGQIRLICGFDPCDFCLNVQYGQHAAFHFQKDRLIDAQLPHDIFE